MQIEENEYPMLVWLGEDALGGKGSASNALRQHMEPEAGISWMDFGSCVCRVKYCSGNSSLWKTAGLEHSKNGV